MASNVKYDTSNLIVWILLSCLVGLIALLFVLYKHLNKESKGEHTIRRMVYKKGGVRDQVRGAALSVGTCLGIRLWPLGPDEDGGEMQELEDEEGHVDGSMSQGSDTEGEDEQDEDEDNAEEQQRDATKEKGDSSENYSSLEGSQAWERAGLTEEQEEKGEKEEEDHAEEQSGERQEKVGEDQVKVEASGGAGLSIDLKQFSGSAIWSEEQGGDFKGSDVTAF